jgi:hypothetical protein
MPNFKGNDNAKANSIAHWPVLGAGLGLVLNALASGIWLDLLLVAPGTHVRPMAEACYALMFAAVGLLFGLPISVAGAFLGRGRKRWLSILGVLLNLAIFPVSAISLRIIAWVAGVALED